MTVSKGRSVKVVEQVAEGECHGDEQKKMKAQMVKKIWTRGRGESRRREREGGGAVSWWREQTAKAGT